MAQFYTAGCFSAAAVQGYQDGILRLFWEMTSCSFLFDSVFARQFTQTVFERTIDDSIESFYDCMWLYSFIYSLLHTHLQWAHLLIRPDPRDWLALLFSVKAIEICLSFPLNRQTHICVHTQAETHRHLPTLTQLNSHPHYATYLVDWRLYLWYWCGTSPSQSLLSSLAACHFSVYHKIRRRIEGKETKT